MPDEEIAARCGLELSLFRRWKKRIPEFAEALQLGKAESDFNVVKALYNKATGFNVGLKKTYKLKRVEYDPDTGKKAAEREDLKDGFEEVHIPADVRVCAYYLNNRDPGRWQEHPKEENPEAVGMVEFPPLAEPEEE